MAAEEVDAAAGVVFTVAVDVALEVEAFAVAVGVGAVEPADTDVALGRARPLTALTVGCFVAEVTFEVVAFVEADVVVAAVAVVLAVTEVVGLADEGFAETVAFAFAVVLAVVRAVFLGVVCFAIFSDSTAVAVAATARLLSCSAAIL